MSKESALIKCTNCGRWFSTIVYEKCPYCSGKAKKKVLIMDESGYPIGEYKKEEE